MVRYSKEHKEKSRKAILLNAAALFRKRGYHGVGIDELCSSAGLTRGAFYTHFKSKGNLFASVLAGPHDLVKRLQDRGASNKQRLNKAGVKIAQDYLAAENRPNVLGGCSLASLAMDTARGDAELQAKYAEAVQAATVEWERGGVSKEDAQTALALCVGGLLIGSACGTNKIGDEVASAARKHLAKLLDAKNLGEHKPGP